MVVLELSKFLFFATTATSVSSTLENYVDNDKQTYAVPWLYKKRERRAGT